MIQDNIFKIKRVQLGGEVRREREEIICEKFKMLSWKEQCAIHEQTIDNQLLQISELKQKLAKQTQVFERKVMSAEISAAKKRKRENDALNCKDTEGNSATSNVDCINEEFHVEADHAPPPKVDLPMYMAVVKVYDDGEEDHTSSNDVTCLSAVYCSESKAKEAICDYLLDWCEEHHLCNSSSVLSKYWYDVDNGKREKMDACDSYVMVHELLGGDKNAISEERVYEVMWDLDQLWPLLIKNKLFEPEFVPFQLVCWSISKIEQLGGKLQVVPQD